MKYIFSNSMSRFDLLVAWIISANWFTGNMSTAWELFGWSALCAFASAGMSAYTESRIA